MEPNFDLGAYEPPVSLWGIVEQHIPVHEHEEIKGMLGESLIDQSIELRAEVIIYIKTAFLRFELQRKVSAYLINHMLSHYIPCTSLSFLLTLKYQSVGFNSGFTQPVA